MKKDSLNNAVTFYLVEGKIVHDSLSIANIDFKYEELKKVNDSLWVYWFYDTNGTIETEINQILIMNNNENLHIAFIGILEFSTLNPDYVDGNYFYILRSSIEKIEDTNSTWIKYYRRTMDTFGGDTIYEETSDSIKLKFNKNFNVFYTHIDTLKGDYSLKENGYGGTENNKGQYRTVWFRDEVVLRIDDNISEYIYLRGNWFFVYAVDKRSLIPFAAF